MAIQLTFIARFQILETNKRWHHLGLEPRNLKESQVQISVADEFDYIVFPCFSSIEQLYSQNELIISGKENVTKTFENRTEDS